MHQHQRCAPDIWLSLSLWADRLSVMKSSTGSKTPRAAPRPRATKHKTDTLWVPGNASHLLDEKANKHSAEEKMRVGICLSGSFDKHIRQETEAGDLKIARQRKDERNSWAVTTTGEGTPRSGVRISQIPLVQAFSEIRVRTARGQLGGLRLAQLLREIRGRQQVCKAVWRLGLASTFVLVLAAAATWSFISSQLVSRVLGFSARFLLRDLREFKLMDFGECEGEDAPTGETYTARTEFEYTAGDT
ncbi:hypothetical protein V8D89_002298 [Ganoderma adspersum]